MRVVAGLLFRDGRILACQRKAEANQGGMWEFPGGKIEPGELPEQALVRELHEELGVHAEVGSLLWRTRHRYPGSPPVEILFYRIRRFTGVIATREFQSLSWVAPGELSALDFLAADRSFVFALDRREIDPERGAPGSVTGER